MIHLRYSLMYGMLESEKDAPTDHPEVVMQMLGITYQHATPQPIGDQWWFWNCKNVPNLLPPFLGLLDLDQAEWIRDDEEE